MSRPRHPRALGSASPRQLEEVRDAPSSPRARVGLRLGQRGEDEIPVIPARSGRPPPACNAVSALTRHPRALGSAFCTAQVLDAGIPSSPRARVGPRARARAARRSPVIPARSGRPPGAVPPGRSPARHPRALGSAAAGDLEPDRFVPSSPRARVGPVTFRRGSSGNPVIPARSGRPTGRVMAGHQAARHPRALGSATRSTSGSVRFVPSSPRARVGPVRPSPGAAPVPVIPARSGRPRSPCL